MPGYKCNMPDILACIGLEQLKKFDKLMKIRRNICKRYYENLKKYNFIIFPVKEEELEYSSCHLLCIQIKDFIEEERDNLINRMSDLNIAMNVHFKPLPLLTAYKNLGYSIEEFNCSNNIYKNVISLPLHYDLTEKEIDYVCKSIVDIIHDIINK